MVDESVRSVTLEGFPLAMTTVILVSVVLATITVALRAIVRMKDGTFGLDDWLIVGAVVRTISRCGYKQC